MIDPRPFRHLLRLSFSLMLAFSSLATPGCGGDAPADEAGAPAATVAEAAARHDGIDPAPFRQQIAAVERELYRSEPATFGTFEDAGQAIASVGRALVTAGDAESLAAGRRLMGLGEAMASRGDVGYAMPDRKALRGEWEIARNEVFRPAAWFAGRLAGVTRGGQGATIAALDRAQTPPSPAPLSGRDRRAIERAIDDYARLCDRGERACERLGEPDYDISVPTARSNAHVDAWHAWARSWWPEVDAVWQDLPPQPGFDADPDLLRVYDQLIQASRQLRDLPRGMGSWPVPFEAQWEGRLDLARQSLDSAREHLEAVAAD